MVLCDGENIADLVPGYTYLYINLFENTYIFIIICILYN